MNIEEPKSLPKPLLQCLEWWEDNIDLLDPHWKIKALHIYKIWINKDRRNKKKFISNFINDNYERINNFCIADNITDHNEWAFKLSYVLMYFYYLHKKKRKKKNANSTSVNRDSVSSYPLHS